MVIRARRLHDNLLAQKVVYARQIFADKGRISAPPPVSPFVVRFLAASAAHHFLQLFGIPGTLHRDL
jgi:hypothetical protein